MARYPDRNSASIPALWAVQRRYGWCTPEGIRQAAAVMRVTPAYLESVASFYDLLHTEPVGSHQDRGLHQHQLLDARRRRAARRLPGRRRGRRGPLRHRLRVPRRLRHRADGLDRRALLRPARGGRGGDRDRAAAAGERGAAREGAGEAAAGRRGARWRRAGDARPARARRGPGAAHARRLQGLRRLRDAGEGLPRDGGRTRSSRSSKTRACAAAAAPASRWAKRPPSCPAARWPSTSAATPTSPSPAPSRTAS